MIRYTIAFEAFATSDTSQSLFGDARRGKDQASESNVGNQRDDLSDPMHHNTHQRALLKAIVDKAGNRVGVVLLRRTANAQYEFRQ